MDGFVEMTGAGSADAPPDVVVLDVSARGPGDSVARALTTADRAMAQIIDLARAHDLAAADLQTTSASVFPQYDREGVSVAGYLAQQSLRLRVRARDRVGPLISAFSEAVGNALTVDNIGLQIDDPLTLLVTARSRAFADAHHKAQQYAELAGHRLGEVVSVTDLATGGGPIALAAARVGEQMADYGGGMPMQMGENTVIARVLVRWAWA